MQWLSAALFAFQWRTSYFPCKSEQSDWKALGWRWAFIWCVKPVGGASFVMKRWALGRKKRQEAAGSPVAMVTFVPGWAAAVCDREAAEDCVSNQCRNLAKKGQVCRAAGARNYLDPVHGIQGSRQGRYLGLFPHSADIELEQLCNCAFGRGIL